MFHSLNNDQRSSPRVLITAKGAIDGARFRMPIQTVNLSQSGMCFRMIGDQICPEKLHLELDRVGGFDVDLRWIHGEMAGVQVNDESYSENLRRYLLDENSQLLQTLRPLAFTGGRWGRR